MSNEEVLNKIRIRVANEEDINFIFSSWLKSFRNSLFSKSIVNTIYFTEHHKLIERIVRSSQVLVACNVDDPSQMYGYVCASRVEGVYCLHYFYIKHSFRKFGIARLLIGASGHNPEQASLYTHHTLPMESIAKRYNLVYHPYILINYLEELENGET